MTERTDVVMRAKGGHDLTRTAMESIRAVHGEVRTVLVDDGSSPAYDLGDADVVLAHESCMGAVSATNTGIGWCLKNDPAPFICVMDNDTEIPAGDVDIFARWQSEFDGDDVGACGATSGAVNPPQHILHVPQTYTADWQDDSSGQSGRKANPEIPVFVSFAVMLRREALAACGQWDEQYNPGNYEDTDYALCLRVNGWKVKAARSVYVHHRCHQTFGADLQDLLNANYARFLNKWGAGRLWDLGALDNKTMAAAIQARQRAMGGA